MTTPFYNHFAAAEKSSPMPWADAKHRERFLDAFYAGGMAVMTLLRDADTEEEAEAMFFRLTQEMDARMEVMNARITAAAKGSADEN